MSRSFGVTIDCRDPERLAAFWSVVLGYVEKPPPAGFPHWAAYDAAHGISAEDAAAGYQLVDPAGARPRLYLQQVPEPKLTKNRVHLDICVDDIELAVAAAVQAGGSVHHRSSDAADPFVTVIDPEGNELCFVSSL